MKYIMFFSFLMASLVSCGDANEKKDRQVTEERALAKTADSLRNMNDKIDSLTHDLQKTTDEVNALLNEVEAN